jgi:hypothetical protein
MTRFVPDHPKTTSSTDISRPHSVQSDERHDPSAARIERLLRGAASADALRHRLALLDIEAQHRLALHRSHFNSDQPRVPAGQPDGGQWTSEGGIKGGSEPRTMSDVTPDNDWKAGARYANNRGRPSVPVRINGQWVEVELGQANRLSEAETRAQVAIARVREFDPNWHPTPSIANNVEAQIKAHIAEAEEAQARLRELTRFQTEPIIPKERPSTPQGQNEVAREIARWLVKKQEKVIEGPAWLFEYEDSIKAYLDPPRTLEELQGAVARPRKGYDTHHIVEQTPAEDDGFPRAMIDFPANLVRIPRFKHWEITAWYMTKNERYEGRSPRQYLQGKDWAERTRVGINALVRYGVLKP